jgi:hypothetical protein
MSIITKHHVSIEAGMPNIPKQLKENEKQTKSHKKHTKRGDRARHGPWHDMATTQPTNPQINHPKKRKIYPT